MVNGQAVAGAARDWIGTPFAHQGRLKHVGCDCAGLVIGIARDLQLVASDFDVPPYSTEPLETTVITSLLTWTTVTEPSVRDPGHVALLRVRGLDIHMGILGEGTLIHAYSSAGKVAEHRLDEKWEKRIVGVFQLPGVRYG